MFLVQEYTGHVILEKIIVGFVKLVNLSDIIFAHIRIEL